jgi:penicillin-binding protein 1C
MLRNLRAGHVVEGGSTISQQVAKLMIARQHGGARRTRWRAKLYEAMVALRLEHRLTKDQILALYLNHAPYGNQIEGAERAVAAYFGRSTATLTAAESAFLAGVAAAASRFNPWRAPRVRSTASRILGTMAARGWLSPADLTVARAERLTLTRESTALVAPHFVAYAITEASGTPHRIDTTLDGRLQARRPGHHRRGA